MTTLPWKYFREFIALEADRFSMLKEILEEAGLKYSITTIQGNRHFFVTPLPEEDFFRRRLTILTAHYDRTPGSPGANDNSAAVFILTETAMKLQKGRIGNWLIIFTDKEELSRGESIQNQGSYSLAGNLRERRMESARIFNFDACGAGDTMIISTTAEYFLKNERRGDKLKASIKGLRENALKTVRDLQMDKVLLVPTPFSDDLGFLQAGIAAQTITVLPSGESTLLVSKVRREPGFAEVLVNQGLRNARNIREIPETWRNLNGPQDNYRRLTPEHFRRVLRFAEALCK